MIVRNGKRKTSHQGAFLFFVVGLFLLQVIFAFTIHGDIGPQIQTAPTSFSTSPQALLSRMETIIETKAPERARIAVQPQAAPAPALKADFSEIESPESLIQHPKPSPSLRENGGRYLEYVVNSGDSLHSISRKLYGKKDMVTVLTRINRIADERGLRTGQRLRVPRQGLISVN